MFLLKNNWCRIEYLMKTINYGNYFYKKLLHGLLQMSKIPKNIEKNWAKYYTCYASFSNHSVNYVSLN